MDGLFWIIGCVVFVVFAMSVGGRGKRYRRPRWTSSSDIDLFDGDHHHH
jgi:hypothetical protein